MIIAYTIGAFCEIKLASNYVTVCTGNIENITADKISLTNTVLYTKPATFDAIITVLNQTSGLHVYKATVTKIDHNDLHIENVQRLVQTDRRAGIRADVGLQALVTIDNEPEMGYDAIVLNMSVTGIAISVHKAFSVGDIITVQFVLNDDAQRTYLLSCKCSIVRTIGSTNYLMRRYGCEFVDMSPVDRQLINDYMAQLRTQMMRQSCI